MYKELYDENHKLISLNPQKYAAGETRIKSPSSGEYEAGILCQECDNDLLGAYETYASKALFGDTLVHGNASILRYFDDNNDLHISTCENIDYKKFKLFLLSILWRAGISKRENFKYVDLGPHEEILRKMIFEGNPGKVDDYPIFTLTYLNDKNMPRDIILTPTKKRAKEGHTIYAFPIGGLIYCFYVNSKQHVIPKYVELGTITPENKFGMAHIPKGEGWDFIFRYTGIKRTIK